MATLEDVLVNRRSVYILVATTDHMLNVRDFIRQLSDESKQETVITDSQGGIMTDKWHLYQVAENPMKSTNEWQKELEEAQ